MPDEEYTRVYRIDLKIEGDCEYSIFAGITQKGEVDFLATKKTKELEGFWFRRLPNCFGGIPNDLNKRLQLRVNEVEDPALLTKYDSGREKETELMFKLKTTKEKLSKTIEGLIGDK